MRKLWLSFILMFCSNLIAQSDSLTIKMIGDAYVQKILNESDEKRSPGKGNIGLELGFGDWRGRVLLTVASNIDTIVSDQVKVFGSSVLNNASKTIDDINQLSLELRNLHIFHKYIGAYGSFTGTGMNWSTAIDTKEASVISWSLGGSLNGEGTWLDNDIFFAVDAGLTGRHIAGNASQDDQFLKATVGTSKKFFAGFELGGQIKVNNMKFFLKMPYLFGDVEGLTDLQWIGGFGVEGLVDLKTIQLK